MHLRRGGWGLEKLEMMNDKKSIEDILAARRANSAAAGAIHPVGTYEHLSDESVLRLYDGIRRQVDADKALGERYRLIGPAARERAESLRAELVRRELKFLPINW